MAEPREVWQMRKIRPGGTLFDLEQACTMTDGWSMRCVRPAVYEWADNGGRPGFAKVFWCQECLDAFVRRGGKVEVL